MNEKILAPRPRLNKNPQLSFVRRKKGLSQGANTSSITESVLKRNGLLCSKLKLSKTSNTQSASIFSTSELNTRLELDLPPLPEPKRRTRTRSDAGETQIHLNGRVSKTKDELFSSEMKFFMNELNKKTEFKLEPDPQVSTQPYYTAVTLTNV